MVRRSLRTRSRKKVKVRTPGAMVVTHFRAERAGRAECGRCGKALPGVPTGSSTYIGSLTPSSRTPERPYGGVLCSDCADELVRYLTRMEVKHSVPEYADLKIQRDLTLEKYLPRGWWGLVSKGAILKKAQAEKPWLKVKPKAKPKAEAKLKAEAKAKPKAKAKAK